MIINTANLTALFTSYKALFKQAFDQATPDYGKIATEVPSGSESNLYAFLGQFPKLRKWVGDRVIKNMAAHNYTVTNEEFESTIGVPRPKIRDDQYGVFSPLFSEMGYAAKMHPDEVIFALLLLGATELCYDGQPFFSASHPIKVDGAASTTSNYDSTASGNGLWVLMDTKHPLKPMIWQVRESYQFNSFTKMSDEHVFKSNEFLYGVNASMAAGFGLWQMAYGSLNTLNGTNFDAAVTAMMALKSDEDKPLGIRPNLLVVGPSNRAAARNLVLKEFLAGGETNPNFKEVDILVSPQLS